MAVISNQNDPNAQQDQNAPQGANGQPLQTIGTAAPASTPTSSAAPARQQPQGSGRFTNLQKYLQANQGGSQRIASNIQNRFNQQAQGLTQGIQGAQQNFQNQVNPLQQQLEQGQQQLQQGFRDPNAVLNNQDQLTNFRNLQQGYGTNISNVESTEATRQQQLQNRLAQLQGVAGLAGTETGRYQLLRNMSNSPGYSQGSQRLDQLLLQSQPNVGNTLKSNLNAVTNQGQQGLTSLEQDRVNRVNALKLLSGQRKQEWQNMLQGGATEGLDSGNTAGLSDIEQNAQARLAAAQGLVSNYGQFQERARGNALTAADLQAVGLAPDRRIYDVDLSQAIRQGQTDPNITSTASGEDVNRYNALRQLAGIEGGGLFGSEGVGTFNPYNTSDLQSKINDRQNYYENTLRQQAVNNFRNQPSQSVVSSYLNSSPLQMQYNMGVNQADYTNRILNAQTPDQMQQALAEVRNAYGNVYDTSTDPRVVAYRTPNTRGYYSRDNFINNRTYGYDPVQSYLDEVNRVRNNTASNSNTFRGTTGENVRTTQPSGYLNGAL